MHRLLHVILEEKSLSRAEELFALSDIELLPSVREALLKLKSIFNAKNYVSDSHSQTVVEITLARLGSSIRETNSIGIYCELLCELLTSCLNHDLSVQDGTESPYAKIASDLVSCLFLHYSNWSVMNVSIPVGVRVLECNNQDLVRSTSSYLALAAIAQPQLLAQAAPALIHSYVRHGNSSLARLLPQIYAQNKKAFHNESHALSQTLSTLSTTADKLSILQLLNLIYQDFPNEGYSYNDELGEYLYDTVTCGTVLSILESISVNFDTWDDETLQHLRKALQLFTQNHPSLQHVNIAVHLLAAIASVRQSTTDEIVDFLSGNLWSHSQSLPVVLKELERIAEKVPKVVCDHLPAIKKLCEYRIGAGNELNGQPNVYHRILNLCNMGSIPDVDGRITVISVDSLTSRNVASKHDHCGQTSSESIFMDESYVVLGKDGRVRLAPNRVPRALIQTKSSTSSSIGSNLSRPKSKSVSHLTPSCSSRQHGKSSQRDIHSYKTSESSGGGGGRPKRVETTFNKDQSVTSTHYSSSILDATHRTVIQVDDTNSIADTEGMVNAATQSTATLLDSHSSSQLYPNTGDTMRGLDAVFQFAEKHFSKIQDYMKQLTVRYPIPCQCTIEECKKKPEMRVHFRCQENNAEFCLYRTSLFSFKTKQPHIWMHLMFLQLQGQSSGALSQTHPAVSKLKHCWQCLPSSVTKRKTFSALVTAAFPNYKGQLKEKKGRWKVFKRWRTRYFTLSSATLSYRTLPEEHANYPAIDLRSVRSVKSVSSGRKKRNIPKAFEIFTADNGSYVFKAKDRKNAEEWFQCLQIAVSQLNT